MKRSLALARVMAVLCATGCFGGVFADDYRTCASDLDCQGGERCLNTSTGAVCVTASDSRCSSSAACPSGTACAADGACRSICDASRSLPCLHGQACKDAVCVGDDARHDPAAAGGLAGVGGVGGAASAGMSGTAGSNAGGAGAQAGMGGMGGASGVAGAAGSQGGGTAGAAGTAGSGSGAGAGAAGSGGAVTGGAGGGAQPCGPGFACDEQTAVAQSTGLRWRRAPGGLATWPAAQDACAGFGAGWRLPTMAELKTILDTKATPAPLADKLTFAFGAGPYYPFWSADLYSASGAEPWYFYLDFAGGYEGPTGQSSQAGYRCVKGP